MAARIVGADIALRLAAAAVVVLFAGYPAAYLSRYPVARGSCRGMRHIRSEPAALIHVKRASRGASLAVAQAGRKSCNGAAPGPLRWTIRLCATSIFATIMNVKRPVCAH